MGSINLRLKCFFHEDIVMKNLIYYKSLKIIKKLIFYINNNSFWWMVFAVKKKIYRTCKALIRPTNYIKKYKTRHHDYYMWSDLWSPFESNLLHAQHNTKVMKWLHPLIWYISNLLLWIYIFYIKKNSVCCNAILLSYI